MRTLLLFFLIFSGVCAIEPIYSGEVLMDPEINWYRYTTNNFEILSVDDRQGNYLAQNIDFIKRWIFERWGMKEIELSTRCKIMCVPDKALYKKLFHKETSWVKIEESQGRIKSSSIWLITEGQHWHTNSLPSLLTEVCLREFELHYQVKFGLWAHIGMSRLDGNLGAIRAEAGNLQNYFVQDKPMFTSKILLTSTAEVYAQWDVEKRHLFDSEALCFCLFLQKEFGKKKFLEYLDNSRSDPQAALSSTLNIKDYETFDRTFYEYMRTLSRNCNTGNTDNKYLTWN